MKKSLFICVLIGIFVGTILGVIHLGNFSKTETFEYRHVDIQLDQQWGELRCIITSGTINNPSIIITKNFEIHLSKSGNKYYDKISSGSYKQYVIYVTDKDYERLNSIVFGEKSGDVIR